LSDGDKAEIKKIARAIMSAQEGNYAAWPKGVDGKIMDSTFSAAPAILEAIRYQGNRILQQYNAQWVAMANTSGTGSYSALQDASAMFITTFNSMVVGFVRQFSKQFVGRLLAWNPSQFAARTRDPELVAVPIKKEISLAELGSFLQTVAQNMPLGEDDHIAIRKASGILPETLPEDADMPAKEEPEPEESPEPEDEEVIEPLEDEELAQATTDATTRFMAWSNAFDPESARLLSGSDEEE